MFGMEFKMRPLIVVSLAVIGVGISLEVVTPATAVFAADENAAPEGGGAKEAVPWRHERGVTFVHYLPDGKGLLSHSWDGTIRLWETPAGKEARRFTALCTMSEAIRISQVNLAPDGRTLVTVEWDAGVAEQTIVVWEVSSGKALCRWKTRTGIDALAFAPDGKSLLSRGRDLAKGELAAVDKLSAIEAAVRVLGEEGRAMNCKALIETMAAKGYWTSPGGKTPASTLYSSLLKEITAKGKEARFVKVGLRLLSGRRAS